jgi:hypothetical protein
MRTKRTPIKRPARRPTFSPRALDLFGKAEAARLARRGATCIVRDMPPGYPTYCTSDCEACERWWTAQHQLHGELGLKPWQCWPCLPHNPYPAGSLAARKWRPDPDDEALAIWQMLDAASRGARGRRSAAKRAGPSW